jgi:uncharacterized protein YggE
MFSRPTKAKRSISLREIIEDIGVALPVPMRAQAGSASMAAPVPIATGEDMLRVKITVGFEIAP